MDSTTIDAMPRIEDAGVEREGFTPLPQAYGMPRLARVGWTKGYSGGHYARVSYAEGRTQEGANEFGDPPVLAPFWERAPHVRIVLGRGDGYLLHAPTEPGSDSAPNVGSEAEFHAHWPAASDSHSADQIVLPPEWLRPLAEAMLRYADVLDNSNNTPE